MNGFRSWLGDNLGPVLGVSAGVLVVGLLIAEFGTGEDFGATMRVTGHDYEPEYYTTRYCTEEEETTDSKGNVQSTTHTYACGEDYHPPTFGLHGFTTDAKAEACRFSVSEGDYRATEDGAEVPIVIHVGGLFGSRTAGLAR